MQGQYEKAQVKKPQPTYDSAQMAMCMQMKKQETDDDDLSKFAVNKQESGAPSAGVSQHAPSQNTNEVNLG